MKFRIALPATPLVGCSQASLLPSVVLAGQHRDSGVSIGILGERENCDGNEERALGEAGLFEYLAESNIGLFNDLGIRKIITLDPHAFNVFSKDYPSLGGEFEVYHYSQVLAPLIESGSMRLNPY